ncbi:formate transporter FocA [Bacterioplanoides sp.]|uniref:formate transporter FocA n=1 Tax=Bacterioplanoides sp. TaxID=2066072 RepID=UPI003AFFAFD4
MEHNTHSAPSTDSTYHTAVTTALYKANKSTRQSFFQAVAAGMFIAIAFVFYITVTTGLAPTGSTRLLGGLVFSIGLILVVICGVELFTSSTLLTLGCFNGSISTRQIMRNWLVVYSGNILGALLIVALIMLAKQYMNAAGEWGANALKIANHKIHHGFFEALTLGILCNLLVCLGVWMTYACRTVAEKILVLILPVALFVSSGFEHSIANLFMVPLGIGIQSLAGPEFWQLVSLNAGDFEDLTVSTFIVANLIPVTLGNIIGGVMVAAIFSLMQKKPTP